MVVLSCLIILLLGLLPALAGWWIVYWTGSATDPRRSAPAGWSRGRSTPPVQPERRYIPGVGYIVGDISCRFNARSGYLRCAVNPMGPCRGCSCYESVTLEPVGAEPD